MKKLIYVIILLTFMSTGITKAQGGYTSFQYVMGFGTGDLGDYISKASFRGAVLEFQRYINFNVSAGVELGWNVFYEKKDYDTYTIEQASYSGIQYRYSNNFPILVSAQYNLKPGELLQPYANFGIGTIYTERATDMGIWRLTETAWHFAIKPEIGMLLAFNNEAALRIGAKYYVGFGSGDLETQSYFALSAGLAFQF